MTGAEFVSGLDKVRGAGTGRWMACCPAHDDKGPSLSIKETDDGRILVHCFAGCSANDVLGSMGLRMTDLFAEPLGNHYSPVAGPLMSPVAAMRSLLKNAYCVGIIAANMNDFGEISDEDRALLIKCISRMGTIFTSTGAER
jgi:hypothetical protein